MHVPDADEDGDGSEDGGGSGAGSGDGGGGGGEDYGEEEGGDVLGATHRDLNSALLRGRRADGRSMAEWA
eukprot:6352780-Prymnesium_polylepis.1